MSQKAEHVIPLREQNGTKNELVVGLIDAIDEDGSVFVLPPGTDKRIRARTAIQLNHFKDAPEQLVGCDALLSVWGANWESAIIVGLVSDTLWSTVDLKASMNSVRDEKIDIRSDGRYVTIDSEKEIALTCGKSSIVLKRDGTVVIKGIRVTSRAAKTNRIKGASVNIN